jgi:hypothetical protein
VRLWQGPTSLLGIAALACLVGVLKKEFDKKASKQPRGRMFPFDSRDIEWNMWTTVLYYTSNTLCPS